MKVLAAAFLMPFLAALSENRCDLKTIEKAKYCTPCSKIDPQINEEGVCTQCEKKPSEVDVCVKTYFACSDCGKRMAEEKACCEEATVRKETLKARVVFKCEGCKATFEKEQACGKEECKEAKKKVYKTCEQTGTWPHGGKLPG